MSFDVKEIVFGKFKFFVIKISQKNICFFNLNFVPFLS